ncbi:MAG: hypothetical protein ACLFQW_00410 [Spirochaetaceae bacterium]
MEGQALVTEQPVFYLFIAITILLTLGYTWGKRRNTRIYFSAFDSLVDTLQPKDKNFIRIGGLTGYHANLIPHKNRFIRRVDATVTLLPRQSWLYMPISRLTRKYDRLFAILFFSKKAMNLVEEGHLIEERYSRFRGPKITNEDKLQSRRLKWGKADFIFYWENDSVKAEFEILMEKLPEPGLLKHVALVPDKEQAFLFMVPKKGHVPEVFPVIYTWLNKLLEKRYSIKKR